MPTMVAGPEQFVDWMRRRGFTQADAARYLEWPEPVVSKLVNGREGIGLERAIKIERLTGIPVEAWISDLASEPEAEPARAPKSKVTK